MGCGLCCVVFVRVFGCCFICLQFYCAMLYCLCFVVSFGRFACDLLCGIMWFVLLRCCVCMGLGGSCVCFCV